MSRQDCTYRFTVDGDVARLGPLIHESNLLLEEVGEEAVNLITMLIRIGAFFPDLDIAELGVVLQPLLGRECRNLDTALFAAETDLKVRVATHVNDLGVDQSH